MGKNHSFSTNCLIKLIKLYQYCLSPLLGNRCRFYPSCSSYALDAFKQHRFFYSIFLIFKRLARCHPWHAGGYDPVPK